MDKQLRKKRNNQIEDWEKEFNENWSLYDWSGGDNFTTCSEEVKFFIDNLLKSEIKTARQELISRIDKIYKEEQGIYHWPDLREMLINE